MGDRAHSHIAALGDRVRVEMGFTRRWDHGVDFIRRAKA